MRYAGAGALRSRPDPVVVDLGYGASPVTVLELADRLRPLAPDLALVGVEIDPERVERGRRLARPGVDFVRGGFEIPLPSHLGGAGREVQIIRAFNVLRQYDEREVAPAWERMAGRLAPDGVLVEGTCDEIGRLASWVDVRLLDGAPHPRSLTFSWRLGGLETPSVVAERLPKVLIHRNVPGEGVHHLLTRLDELWLRHAGLGGYGARQRFLAAVADLRAEGWPVLDGPARWRLGELTVAWEAVAPQARS